MLVISAPFGGYLQWPGTRPTLGTFTFKKRAGFFGRWWRVLKTVRFARGTVVNQLGLPSPGVQGMPKEFDPEHIVSVHGFDSYEWLALVYAVGIRGARRIELNLSCPNVESTTISDAIDAVRCTIEYSWWHQVTVKLGPVRPMAHIEYLYKEGIRSFHLCNTIPTSRGGVSGAALKPFSLWAVEDARQRYPDLHIIGGGGVYNARDAQSYIAAGANDVAIGSMLLNPFNWPEVKRIRYYLENAPR